MDKRVIANKDDAINILKELLTSEIDRPFEIEFHDWPKLDIIIKGKNYHSSLPSRLLKPLSELQEALYRVYAEQVHGGDIRHLTNEEKEQLELVFTIRDGSTEILSNLASALEKLIDAMANDPKNFTLGAVVAATVALTWIGGDIYLEALEKEIKVKLAEEDNERLKIFTNAINQAQRIRETEERVVAAAYDAEEVIVGERTYSHDEIQALNETQRSKVNENVFTHTFIIDGIRNWQTYDGKNATVYLIDVDNNNEIITAKLNKLDPDFTPEDKKRFHQAFENGKPIRLALLQRRRPDGTITSSKVVTIKDIIDKQPETTEAEGNSPPQ